MRYLTWFIPVALLASVFAIKPSAEPGDAVLKSACRLNLEGIVSKRADAPYVSGRSESWVKANPDVARRLRTALERATKYLDSASKEERDEWIAKYTGVKLEVVKEIHLPLYVTEFNVSTLQANLDILVRQKLTRPFDVNAMIYKP